MLASVMTEQDLRALIARGESLTLEFKRDAPLGDDELVEAVVCLANTEGGTLLLGVEDDGTVSGLHDSHLPAHPRALEALIANRTIPGVRLSVQLVDVGGKLVAVLEVTKAPGVVQSSDGRSFHRFWAGGGEPECRPMRPNEIASRLAHLGKLDYSAQVLHRAAWKDLDPLELERLKQEVERNSRADKSLLELSNEALAQALELVVESSGRLVPTVAGVLLVGHEKAIRDFVPTHEAAFQVLRPKQQVEVNEFFRGPLVKLFRRFEDFLVARNPEEEFSLGIQRIGVPRYSLEAFREALANALVHRDYTLNYMVQVKIDHVEGGLVITSPGGFVEGVGIDNLLITGPRPRNRVLADAFKRLGLVERAGRGVERIFEYVLELGRPAPSYAGSDRSSVRVFLPGGDADLAFVKFIIELKDRQQQPLDWRLLLLLRRVADEGELTTAEAAGLIQREAAQARGLLESMVEQGLLEAKGVKRSRSYHLSAGVYERLGKTAAYVRRRGVDEIQQEQMVIRYLQQYGRIKRRDVMELLPQLNRDQASYLLRRMAEKGVLEAFGEKRGRFYELSEKT